MSDHKTELQKRRERLNREMSKVMMEGVTGEDIKQAYEEGDRAKITAYKILGVIDD